MIGKNGGDAAIIQEVTEAWAASVLPRREPGAHKWGVGGVVVVAGSPPYAGAAALCCASAGRAGAGIVSAALSRSVIPIVVGLVPEITVIILPEGDSTSAAKRAAEAIGARLDQSAAIVIGPGLGSDESSDALLGALFGTTKMRGGIGFGSLSGAAQEAGAGVLAKSDRPIVIDADALNWLSSQDAWWDRLPKGKVVLTPHVGEMSRLTGSSVEEVLQDPRASAVQSAKRWRQIVLLKGAMTIVADPGGAVRGVETHPRLATAGSGDVLSGAIGALLAQGLSPFDAAALAIYAGGRAGARAADRFGTLGLIAGDLPIAFAEELAALEKLGV